MIPARGIRRPWNCDDCVAEARRRLYQVNTPGPKSLVPGPLTGVPENTAKSAEVASLVNARTIRSSAKIRHRVSRAKRSGGGFSQNYSTVDSRSRGRFECFAQRLSDSILYTIYEVEEQSEIIPRLNSSGIQANVVQNLPFSLALNFPMHQLRPSLASHKARGNRQFHVPHRSARRIR